MPQDNTPLGDAMTHRPKRMDHDIPPDNLPPKSDPGDDKDSDGKPKAPPPEDEPGRRYIPIDLPGREHAPERAG